MLQAKSKISIEIPESVPWDGLIHLTFVEPIVVPRPGRPWTVTDLEALAGDEKHYELVRGDLLMMSPASPTQGRYASRLVRHLGAYVDDHDLGEVYTAEPGFELQTEPEIIVRAPDVAFVRKERIPNAFQQAGFWQLSPDLVVEIISPSESAGSVQDKVNDYLQAGTRMIWLVYPNTQTVVEHGPSGSIRQFGPADALQGGDVIPGYHLPLSYLFH